MINAIQTSYKGYRFRSRLEARWAVFFDALGLKWEYEPEGFDLGGVGHYLPDFLLPELYRDGLWVEVKHLGSTDTLKAKTLARHSGRSVLFLDGPPDLRTYDMFTHKTVDGDYLDDRVIFHPEYLPGGGHASEIRMYSEWFEQWTPAEVFERLACRTWCISKIKRAIFDARAARFEHGESGAA